MVYKKFLQKNKNLKFKNIENYFLLNMDLNFLIKN